MAICQRCKGYATDGESLCFLCVIEDKGKSVRCGLDKMGKILVHSLTPEDEKQLPEDMNVAEFPAHTLRRMIARQS